MEFLKMKSFNVIDNNIRKIAQLFPNCVTERKGKSGKLEFAIDFEKLRIELSDEIIIDGEERYQFIWPDKCEAVRLANLPTTMTLRPCRKESLDFDDTQNLYIEGDNLDVLKVLRETYLGKVKMIYIDPPYNTGNDFVYNDDFTESYLEFAESCKIFDEDGKLQFDPKVNGESNGRFHTDWLNMIYPRLKVARDLLSEEGVIFISIDDNEVENLSKVCDEIFGEQNFVANFVWKKKTGAGANISHVFNEHEYIICFAKSKSSLENWRIISENEGDFRNPDNDPNGPWQSCALTAPSKNRNPNQLYKIEIHFNKNIIDNLDDSDVFDHFIYNGHTIILRHLFNDSIIDNSEFDPIKNIACFIKRWAYAKQNIKELFLQNKVYINGKNVPRYKKYAKDNEGKALRSIYYNDFSTQQGTESLRDLFSINIVEYPKPIELILFLIKACTNSKDICLDFFSGSATTAHAVMKLNAEDGGNRKFIMVQLPEKTDEKSEAYKAGYKNICEIGKERIRRAGKKVKEEAGLQGQNLDTGFRVLKLDSSNMEDVYYTPQEFSMASLFNENVKVDRSNEDLLFQVMLDLGIELSAKIETKQIAGKQVHIVDEGYLVACFDRDVNESTIIEIAKQQPVYFVMRDASAANDNVIDNFEQIFRHYSPDTSCRII